MDACDLEGSKVFSLLISAPSAARSARQRTILLPSLAETTAKLAMSPSGTTIFDPLSRSFLSSQARFSCVGAVVVSVCARVPTISPAANLGK